MYIYEARNEAGLWISGIFQRAEDAKTYDDTIPDELKPFHALIERTGLQYPFYIIENGGFAYTDRLGAIEALDRIEPRADDDTVYFNLYYVRTDYKPSKPGADQMGLLSHLHIDNGFVRHYKRQGIGLLIRNRMMEP
ncbi:hypothetical protein [Paenibacillus flagellatus]|uniref:Uncharacterized protein n=1 Tax=Paenibacillus flagellatus TaxID=2211139 RepID=A0A2V5K4M2_9BACL|nr:hypothetical protein [Paenibacillus flagellatus]PYI54265.1 hypothetical protein DLM86_12350 [Paenibacillus flagellatus]